RTSELRQRESLSFDTTDGGVFFRCVRTECATLEGGDRSLFEKLSKELHWQALYEKGTEKTTADKPANRGIGAPQQSSAPASSAIRSDYVAGELPKLRAGQREPLDHRSAAFLP